MPSHRRLAVALAWMIASWAALGCRSTGAPPPAPPPHAAAPAEAESPAPDPSSALFGDDPFWGLDEPAVTVVIVGSILDPATLEIDRALRDAGSRLPTVRVSYVFVPGPVNTRSAALTRWLIAAHQHGDYWAVHDEVTRLGTNASELLLKAALRTKGLDLEQMQRHTADAATDERLEELRARGTLLGAEETTKVFINEQPLDTVPNGSSVVAKVFEVVGESDRPGKGHRPGDAHPRPNYAVPTHGRPATGPDDALVTIVEFTDATCAECRITRSVVRQVLDRHPDIRHVVRQLCDDERQDICEAAAVAGRLGKFWPMQKALEAHRGVPTPAELIEIAATLGIDRATFDREHSAGKASAQLDRVVVDVFRSSRQRGPILFVNGRFLSGAIQLEDLDRLIIEERDKARTFLAEHPEASGDLYEAMRRTWRGLDVVDDKSSAITQGG